MMRTRLLVALLIIPAVALAAGSEAAAQRSAKSIAGVWVGPTEVPGHGTDQMTVTVTRTGSGLAGTIADSLGVIAPATPIKNLRFADKLLSGSFPLADGAIVTLKVKLEGGSLKGQWSHEAGDVGEITLERKKK